MIQVKNITKTYKTGEVELTALKNVSFEVPSGQFLAITGRSGSGKSTLLHQIGLLDHADEGEIIINNKTVSKLDESQRVTFRRNFFGFIFQDYAILPTLTSLENVVVPILMQGVDEATARRIGIDALKNVGLFDRIDRLPSQLSGGQQQRVSIARAIAHHPKILFADEPTANLDTESSNVILNTFLKLNRMGQTIIMVTHEPDYAKLADRHITLRDGRIIEDKMKKAMDKSGRKRM